MLVSKAPGLVKMQPICAAVRTILCIHFTTDDQLSVGIIISGIGFIFGFVISFPVSFLVSFLVSVSFSVLLF